MRLNAGVQNLVWPKAIQASADPERAKHFSELLKATSGVSFMKRVSAEQARVLAAIFSGSQALSELLLAHPNWIEASLLPEHLQHPRQKQGLERDLQTALKPLLIKGD